MMFGFCCGDNGAKYGTCQGDKVTNSAFGERLKAERERLRYTQPEFAEMAGASKRTQIGWEQGRSVPDANALAAWLEEGVDIGFLLSGERSNGATSHHLPADEQLLLEAYRGMGAAARKALLADLLTGGKTTKRPARASGGVVVQGNNNRTAGRDLHGKE
tara:strand:+ start:1137 stop:1616 length:480 start_codon:yes stop_codon:yes gene_type:complete